MGLRHQVHNLLVFVQYLDWFVGKFGLAVTPTAPIVKAFCDVVVRLLNAAIRCQVSPVATERRPAGGLRCIQSFHNERNVVNSVETCPRQSAGQGLRQVIIVDRAAAQLVSAGSQAGE